MARKKPQTYNDMVRMMTDMQEKLITEKNRIAKVLASALDYRNTALLGDFSDAELLRVADLLFDHLGACAGQVRAEKGSPRRSRSTADGPLVEGELRRNFRERCWEIWDTDADAQIGKIYPEMDLEFFEGGQWVPAKIKMMVTDDWHMETDKQYSPRTEGRVPMFDGWRVRARRIGC